MPASPAKLDSLAVFCDFDGTFSVQDVGSTLAKQRLGERRAQLWAEYEAGGQTAWEYTAKLFQGFELPESELQAFLESIELDPGAAALVAWCAQRDVPFRILSDGFDYNLERLQAIHGVRFEFTSNQLQYAEGRWQIAPGGPDPSCGCGTGTCKQSIISAFRTAHPGAYCVHIGNGRVSDTCGAIAADLAFAKETLAEELERRGEPFVAYHDLNQVRAELETRCR